MNQQQFERIAGIKEDLPAGEHVLWQGAPSWRELAVQAFHVREVGVYFALLTLVSGFSSWYEGQLLLSFLLPATLGILACALLGFLAWMSARTTIYAITTGRVFLRVGIALPIFLDLPLQRIEGAGLALHAHGCGDLPLQLEPSAHLAFVHLWPHARPWRLQRPEPMMRSVANAEHVAQVLAQALRTAHASAPVHGQESTASTATAAGAIAATGNIARPTAQGMAAA